MDLKGHQFTICDVGGQLNEWRNDVDDNAMNVSLSVFAEIVNSTWFTAVPFIMFLHKSDLFDNKIKSVPIKAASCF